MKGKRCLSLLMALLLLTALLAGCGSANSSAKDAAAVPQAANAQSDEVLAGVESANGVQPPENRKWIITGEIRGETEDLDTLLDEVYGQIETLGGYVEDQNVYHGASQSKNRYRSAELTARIPAERVDEFAAAVEEAANVVSSSKNLEDVTLSYTDNETRLEALKIEEARLMELMKNAQNMSDLLEIEGRLTDVHYEMERVTSRLRTYDNQIDYATIRLFLEEVREYTPVEPTVWERISGGFSRSLVGVKDGIVDFFVWVIAKSPYLVVWGLIAALIVLLVRTIEKNKKKKNGKKPGPNLGGNASAAPGEPPVPPTGTEQYTPFPPKNEKKK